MSRSILSLAGVLLLGTGCAEQQEQVRIGAHSVPAAILSGLADTERHALLDLLGFGAAVMDGQVDTIAHRLAEREAEEATLARLPLHLGAGSLGLDEARLRASYAENPEWELVVRHVVRLAAPGDPPAERAEAARIAGEVTRRAAAGEDFGALAGSYSEEPGAADRGGLLQPGRRGSWVEPFWNAAVALTPGQTTGVVETEYGFHVLRLDERRPVPFEETDRAALLLRIVPPDVAMASMEAWVARSGGILVDPFAVSTVREQLLAGSAMPDTLVVAMGAGGSYSAVDLERGWARLTPERRMEIEREDDVGFASWIESDARQLLWGRAARALGMEAPPEAYPEARSRWDARLARWARTFGFTPGMATDRLATAAADGMRSGLPEARSARQEVRSLRPLLRRLYPADASPP